MSKNPGWPMIADNQNGAQPSAVGDQQVPNVADVQVR